jgi:hypothetical protein
MAYTVTMTEHARPSRHILGKLAENQPELLNLLVAYFVFEWKSVRRGNPHHGVDQMGITRHVPNYIEMWSDRHTRRSGIGNAINLLLQCPAREPDGPGFLDQWMRDCSEIETEKI